MGRLSYSAAFCLLLTLSLGLKLSAETAPLPDETQRQSQIPSFLDRNGFTVTQGDIAEDPVWTTGTKRDCRVQIADVSPQGWLKALVAERGAGQRVVYVYDGSLYSQQPVLRTAMDDYWRRFERYLGIAAPPPAIRAMILSPGCPADLLNAADIARLSA